MGLRNVLTISSCLLGLLFSILVLIPGCHKGVLDRVAIATYRYPGNYSLIYPPTNTSIYPSSNFSELPNPVAQKIQGYGNDLHEWFFSVHYLAICAGYMGGSENPDYVNLDCWSRHGGFSFSTDDESILSYQSIGDLFPVTPLSGDPDTFNLQPPFAMLVLGIAFTVLSLPVLVYEAFITNTPKRLGSLSVALLGIAANSLLISSAIVTVIIKHSDYTRSQYDGWTRNFVGLTWTSVAFMYLAFVIRLSHVTNQKEKMRLVQAQ
ncbi:hypothetical protein F5884DRAFT_443113 [Xylogone sp. PMI_703]|nr:hypothetical protein F5884DRAFT_443113 [Xylogone sp. PMI_703]